MEACGFAFSHLFLEHEYLSKALWPEGDSAGQLASLSCELRPLPITQVLPGVLIS